MAFRDYILHNFWWKLLSLLVAALTWLTIETSFKKEAQLRETPVETGPSSRSFPGVPVTLLSSAANAGRFTVTPQAVTVKVAGKLEDLQKLQVSDIRAFVDVTDAEDEMKFRKTIQVQVPRDFSATADHPLASLERTSNSKSSEP
jgi:YbbR domain-containing protein